MGGIGFRDMLLFNQSLLCKQGWRLLQNSNTLAYHVLKAKYFPDTDFLKADMGTNPSLTWRSICSTQSILERGIMWRVGNGKSIGIWEDKWAMGTVDGYLTEPSVDLQDIMMVSDLMIQRPPRWNVEFINQIFTTPEAKAICAIPLTREEFEDVKI